MGYRTQYNICDKPESGKEYHFIAIELQDAMRLSFGPSSLSVKGKKHIHVPETVDVANT